MQREVALHYSFYSQILSAFYSGLLKGSNKSDFKTQPTGYELSVFRVFLVRIRQNREQNNSPNTDTFYSVTVHFTEDLLAFIFNLEPKSFIHLIKNRLQQRCISNCIWICVLTQVGKGYKN